MFLILRAASSAPNYPEGQPPELLLSEGGSRGELWDGERKIEFETVYYHSWLERLIDLATERRLLETEIELWTKERQWLIFEHSQAAMRARVLEEKVPQRPKQIKRYKRRIQQDAEYLELVEANILDALVGFAGIVRANLLLIESEKAIDARNQLLAGGDLDFYNWICEKFGGTLPNNLTPIWLDQLRTEYDERDLDRSAATPLGDGEVPLRNPSGTGDCLPDARHHDGHDIDGAAASPGGDVQRPVVSPESSAAAPLGNDESEDASSPDDGDASCGNQD